MDKQCIWKRTEETEIDLADFLRKLFGQWKRITACALTAAVILSAYGWLKTRGGPKETVSDMPEGAVLTESEEREVADAVRQQNEIRGLESYLENSVLMQIDPYHKNRYTMLYCIDQTGRQNVAKITECYLNFVANGGAADALSKTGSWHLDRSYLAELISVHQKTYSYSYQVIMDDASDSSMLAESLFYVEVTGTNAKEAEKMALDLQDVLKEYSLEIKKTFGNHRLALLNSAENIIADSGLQTQQHDKRNLLASNIAALKVVTDAFSKEQLAVYQEKADAEGWREELEEGISESGVTEAGSGFWIQYVFTGLIGGDCIHFRFTAE